MCNPCSCDRHTPEIKLAEMRQHLSLAPMSLWTGKAAGLAPNSPLFLGELDEWVHDSIVYVSHRDKLTLFEYRTADILENKMVI